MTNRIRRSHVRHTLASGLGLVLSLTGCKGSTEPGGPTPSTASQLAFATQPTSATAGAAISPAVAVAIQDAQGNTVTNATTSITVAIGTNPAGGTLAGTATAAAVSGVATFSTLSIDKAGTDYRLTATATSLTGATSAAFTVTAGAAAKLAFTVQPTNATAATPISPAVQVKVQDAQGNTVTSATASVTVALGTNPSEGTLSGTTTAAAVLGVATFANLSLDKTGSGYTLTAAATSLTGATSAVFTVTNGLSNINMDAPSSSIAIGGTVQIAASPRDQYGRAIAVTVTWSSSDNAVATVSGSGLATGVASGTALITASASTGATTISSGIAINVMPPWAGPAPPRNVLVNDPRRSSFPNIRQFEPSVALFGSRIVVGWNDESVGGQTIHGINWSVGYGYSTDGGSTFADAGEVGSSHWGADPSVAVDRAGIFYFGRIDLLPGSATLDRIAVFKSTDGGATFPQAATASDIASRQSRSNDGPMIVADNTASPFSGNVYASWIFHSSDAITAQFSRSTDGGASFSPPIELSTGGMPAIGPNGEVYVGGLSVTKSTDGGLSFGPAVRVASADPIGEIESETAQYCGRVLKGSLRAGSSPSIAVDRSGGPNSGTVYVVFGSHGAGTDGADVYLTRSRDGGATWSTPSRLNDDATTNDQWLAFVVVAPNGAVAVSWYDRRLDPQNLLIDVFMRISTDGGASFGPNLKITEVSFPPPPLNLKLGFPPYSCLMSDYNFMAADATNFYVVWTDDRMVTSGTVDPNIFFAKIPY